MRTFFGLTDDYQQDVYEQIFSLKYHGGWSVMEVYNLPVQLRGMVRAEASKTVTGRIGANKQGIKEMNGR
jgi:hypothetical protein